MSTERLTGNREKLCDEISKEMVRLLWTHEKIKGTHDLGSHGASGLQKHVYDFLFNHVDFKEKDERTPGYKSRRFLSAGRIIAIAGIVFAGWFSFELTSLSWGALWMFCFGMVTGVLALYFE